MQSRSRLPLVSVLCRHRWSLPPVLVCGGGGMMDGIAGGMPTGANVGQRGAQFSTFAVAVLLAGYAAFRQEELPAPSGSWRRRRCSRSFGYLFLYSRQGVFKRRIRSVAHDSGAQVVGAVIAGVRVVAAQ
jgi:hypothetical protein